MSAAGQQPPHRENDLSRRAEEEFQRQRSGKVWLTVGWLILFADALLWFFVPKDLQSGRHFVLGAAIVGLVLGLVIVGVGLKRR
jgi:hypothetical protein